MTVPVPDWPQRVRDARARRDEEQAHYEQTVRDAHHIGGMSANKIAAALGRRSREQITRYLGTPAPEGLPRPRLPLVVLLRGKGMPQQVLDQLYDGCAARGWFATLDHEAAWHLARGGCTTVFTDVSAGLKPERIDVRLVAARYRDDRDQQEEQDPDDETAAAWPDWKTLAGADDYPRPRRYDEESRTWSFDAEQVIRLIAQVSGAIDDDATG
ncbi:hypothetical protein ABZ135_23410 [Streptomyces sp. NPDC006339]|uniref:hypothetical protein n=1 Tax=Streptomyces sp. NPDC006339 TaxID=3156755 RepID=UPI0033A509AB